MKAKVKYLFTLIIILYFSNSWEIEAEFQNWEIPTNYNAPFMIDFEVNSSKSSVVYFDNTMKKDGVVVGDLRDNQLKINSLRKY
ncbi:MAG: hypothetical protein CMB99_13085 [Flavobacteriaceae bacterium]|nr:hypothetical protein [Flavobacteriaceae bacterium]|tara:strand:- start:18136 stop:18387 length:252 start_codon:yes stop_codon:yes gene_type:complete